MEARHDEGLPRDMRCLRHVFESSFVGVCASTAEICETGSWTDMTATVWNYCGAPEPPVEGPVSQNHTSAELRSCSRAVLK